MSYLTCNEGGSDKFYQILVVGNDVSIKYGKTGSDGVSSIKSFKTAAEANKFLAKTVAEKIKKGYVEGGAVGSKRAATSDDSSAKKKTKSEPASKPAKSAPKAAAKPAAKATKAPTKAAKSVSSASPQSSTYLTCQEGVSNKFYEISFSKTKVTMRYGRVGSDGVTSIKEFGSVAETEKFVNKTIADKIKKGYEQDGAEEKEEEEEEGSSSEEEEVEKVPREARHRVSSAIPTYLTCQEGASNKFYEISYVKARVTMRYGRVGSEGVTSVKQFDSLDETEKFVEKTIAEKIKKGYERQGAEESEDEENEKDEELSEDEGEGKSGAKISYADFKKAFGKLPVPLDLANLFAFDQQQDSYYATGFEFAVLEKEMLKTYSEKKPFLDSFIEFAQADGTGSTYAFWITPGLTKTLEIGAPIVVFGSEGGYHVVARNVLDLIQILSFDAEPMVDHDAVTYFREEDEPNSKNYNQFQNWITDNRDRFGLFPFGSADEYVAAAQAMYGTTFASFMAKYVDE